MRSTRLPALRLKRVINSPPQAFAGARDSRYNALMEQARMDRALNRIETALDRIGSAARQRAQAPSHGQADDPALRASVTAALGELDQLSAALER